MPPPPGLHALTDQVLADLYDPGALVRGRAYAAEGRVQLLTTKPGSLRAVVEGSGRNTYVVQVMWEYRAGGIQIGDSCSCPLGDACKHAVATILEARDSEPDPAQNWRQALSSLVGGGTEGSAAYEAQLAPMALEVVLSNAIARRYAARADPGPVLRPLRLGRSGRWVRSGATWRDVSATSSYSGYELRTDHLSLLRSMLAGARLPGFYPDAEAIPLGSFGPQVWTHLSHAVTLGIELVGEGSKGTVRLSRSSARAAVDLTSGASGSVAMRTSLLVDDEPVSLQAGRAGLVGHPGHGLYRTTEDGLELIPLNAPLTATVTDLLQSPALVVPASDVDELLTAYQPRLARLVPVGSSDGSVTITSTEFEGISLVIERPDVGRASLRWYMRYRRGAHTSEFGLRAISFNPVRDPGAEAAALDKLDLPTDLLPAIRSADRWPADLDLQGADAVILLTEVLAWLVERDQVRVELVGNAPELRESREDPLISLRVSEPGAEGETAGEGRTDWFDLGIEVTVEGEPVPFAELFTALATDQPVLVLATGTWIRLDRPELARLKELIEESRGLAEPDGDADARVNRFQVDWWEELAGLGVVEAQSARWASAMQRMRDLSTPEPVALPTGLDATLRPYQQEGLDWLAFLHRHGLGGILADDMGLGKTVQTIALALHLLEQDPETRVLVVAPTSVVENWHKEAARFAPGVPVRTIHGTQARRGSTLAEAIGDARIVVTSYALFRIEFEAYQALHWDLFLLDEAQFVKNHQGKTYQCARRLDVTTKIAITGTPLENSLMDLWSLLSITAPGLFPDPKRFAAVYRKPIEAGRSPELLATLRRRIAPLMRRRTKDEVLSELPPKIEQTVEVELSPKHSRIYQTQLQRQRTKVLGLVGDVQRHRFEILKSLTILRQLSLDPGLVDPEHDAVGSAKLDRLVEDLVQVLAEGHRALVFSQFTRFLARVRARLDAAGVEHSYLDGRTRDRGAAIDKFTSGEVPVFVISLKAGGFGLNLTQADYCFVLDPWWNPAVETQAVDRAHRIGQPNPVVVYRYVSAGTIEEKVMELKAKKAALFSEVVDAEGALSGALTEADLRGLFELPEPRG